LVTHPLDQDATGCAYETGYIGRKDGCIKCTTSKGCKGNTFCDVGYVGPSGRTPCDLCAPGFYNPTTGTTDVIECKECAATKAWVLVVAVLLLLLLALVIVWFNKIPLLQRVGLPLRNGLVYIQGEFRHAKVIVRCLQCLLMHSFEFQGLICMALCGMLACVCYFIRIFP